MLRINTLLCLASCVSLLAGCSMKPVITEAETRGLVASIEAQKIPFPDLDDRPVYWSQASNKTETCLLSRSKEIDDAAKRYWDGECKDGYAFGLGREFAIDQQGGVAATIGAYLGGEQKPNEYAHSDFVNNTYMFGDTKNKRFTVIQVEDAKDFDLEMSLLGIDGDAMYSKVIKLTDGNTSVSAKTYGTNFKNGYFIETQQNPNGSTIHGFYTKRNNQYVGYFIRLDESSNISSSALIDGEWKPVTLPQSYIDFAIDIATDIEKVNASSEKAFNEADAFVDQYRARICGGNSKPSFLDVEQYGRICEEQRDLSVFAVRIKDRKEQISRVQSEEYRRQQLAQQNAVAQGQELARLLTGLAGLGSAMNSAGNAALQQSQAYSQPQQPSFNWAPQKKSYGTPVYSESECTGAVVMGRCTGAVIPNNSKHETCYGAMVNGVCSGSQF